MRFLRKFNTARKLFFSDRAALYHKLGLYDPVKRHLAKQYLRKQGVLEYLVRGIDGEFGCGDAKYVDLYNLYTTIRRDRPLTIIEFGCGFSSIAMAHALRKNYEDYGKKGKLYIVEASEKWANNVEGKLIPLKDYVDICRATPRIQLLGSQICHVFEKLPDARPDLIYLDGPDPQDVFGSIHGLSMQKLTMVCAADPLLYEWAAYPGFKIIVDGRYNNVEFLRRNLKRKYQVKKNFINDYTMFELMR